MDLGIKGKVAVVTGAAALAGNGAGIARALAAEGADIACADIDITGAQALARELEQMGQRAIAMAVDQSEALAVQQAAARISRELGTVDILVNNAAITSNISLLDRMETADWEREVRVNLSGAYYWTRAVFPGILTERT